MAGDRWFGNARVATLRCASLRPCGWLLARWCGECSKIRDLEFNLF